MKKIKWETFDRSCTCCGETVSIKGWRKFLIWFLISVVGVSELQVMMELHNKGFFRQGSKRSRSTK